MLKIQYIHDNKINVRTEGTYDMPDDSLGFVIKELEGYDFIDVSRLSNNGDTIVTDSSNKTVWHISEEFLERLNITGKAILEPYHPWFIDDLVDWDNPDHISFLRHLIAEDMSISDLKNYFWIYNT